MRGECMRFWMLAPLFSVLAACYPAAPLQRPSVRAEVSPDVPAVGSPPIILESPEAPLRAPEVTTAVIQGITFEGVAFDARSHRLVVADQAAGPGTEFLDAASAARSRGGLAAINAGFFTPEGAPLGLVVSQGVALGAWNSASSLGSGLWREDARGQMALVRREALGRSAAGNSKELIQAGPLLRENGRLVTGLESTKLSLRTLILHDGGTRWWIGRGSPCSLADLGNALAAGNPAGWPVVDALNLDGGRSSDLWASSAIAGGPLVRRTPWNRAVRNFLILIPR
jgi:hypothetical protein